MVALQELSEEQKAHALAAYESAKTTDAQTAGAASYSGFGILFDIAGRPVHSNVAYTRVKRALCGACGAVILLPEVLTVAVEVFRASYHCPRCNACPLRFPIDYRPSLMCTTPAPLPMAPLGQPMAPLALPTLFPRAVVPVQRSPLPLAPRLVPQRTPTPQAFVSAPPTASAAAPQSESVEIDLT